jgi:hypothetical protein
LRILKTKWRARDNNFLSNLPVIIALIMLGSTPLLILLNEQEIANQTAASAYYLLIVGVIWKVIQYLNDMRNPVLIEKNREHHIE